MTIPEFNIPDFKQGDKQVFDAIYRHYHKKVYRFAHSFLKTEADAVDMVQEVFIKLWESRALINEDKGIEALLFSIAKNTTISVLRKRSTEQKYLSYLKFISSNIHSDSTDALSSYNILKNHLENITGEMPPKRKAVFRLSREECLSNKEIAAQLNISEKTVEGHLTKALAEIKKKMEPMGLLAVLFLYLQLPL